MQVLINKIRSSINLSSEAEQYIFSIAKEKKVSKGEVLIRQGQTVNKTFFVVHGSLRSFCLDKEGKEHTLQFAIKDWWISDFMGIYNNEPASLKVECISDSAVIEFNVQKLNEIYLRFPELESFQRKNLLHHLIEKYLSHQLHVTFWRTHQ